MYKYFDKHVYIVIPDEGKYGYIYLFTSEAVGLSNSLNKASYWNEDAKQGS